MLTKIGSIGYRFARRIVIGIVGGTVVLIGIVMFVTPGPALVVIPIGLAILSLEFAWAKHWLHKIRENASREGLEKARGHYSRWRDRLFRPPRKDPPGPG